MSIAELSVTSCRACAIRGTYDDDNDEEDDDAPFFFATTAGGFALLGIQYPEPLAAKCGHSESHQEVVDVARWGAMLQRHIHMRARRRHTLTIMSSTSFRFVRR